MPKKIKIAMILLLLSAILPFFASYLYVIDLLGLSEGQDILYDFFAVNFFWLCFILYMIWSIKNHKDFRVAIGIIAVISLGFAVWDYIDFGHLIPLVVYLLEALILFIVWHIMGRQECRGWVNK